MVSAMIRIKISFDLDEDFIAMFKRAVDSTFIDIGEELPTIEETEKLLRDVQTTQKLSGYERLGFLRVMLDDKCIGLSMPRVIKQTEHVIWGLPKIETYYRMGMIFLDEEYRGKGYAKDAAWEFKRAYKKILWCVDPKNIPSIKVAQSINLQHTLDVYFDENMRWSHRPREECKKVLQVWRN